MKTLTQKLIRFLPVILLFTFLTACSTGTESDSSKKADSDSKASSYENSGTVPELSPSPTEVPEEQTPAVTFSVPSGFYQSEFDLSLTAPDETYTVYYTLDGSIPDENSTKYTAPIKMRDATEKMNVLSGQKGVNPSGDFIPKDRVMKCNVIRAVAIDESGKRTDTANATYFVGIDRKKNFSDAPVISMFTDFDNLFGYENGIYIMGKTYDDWVKENEKNARAEGWQKKGNFSNKGREWEREGAIEYLPADDSEGFVIDLGISIMGAASRGNMQKSFRLKCREEYGEKSLKYNLVPDNLRSNGAGEVTKYKSFLLRDGGNDCDYSKFRDPLLQDLVENRSFETQQSGVCVLFINGEYWGMYALTEDYSDNYIENNYSVDNDNIIIVKRGEIEEGLEEDIDLYNEMKDFILENDMSLAENYDKACEMLDMKSYIEYCAFNIYIDNQDSYFKDNNWQMWRVREPDENNEYADGKWHIMAYDTEFSTGLYSDGKTFNNNSFKNALREKAGGGRMFAALMENEEFKTGFIRTLCDMRNIDFEWGRTEKRINYWDSLYGPLVPDTISRFGPDWIVRWNDPRNYYRDKVKELKTWLKGRYENFSNIIKDTMDLTDAVDVNIYSSDYAKGGFRLNGSGLVFEKDFEGQYFRETGFEVHAVSKDGAEFDHWEIENGRMDDNTKETAVIFPEAGCRVTAVFK